VLEGNFSSSSDKNIPKSIIKKSTIVPNLLDIINDDTKKAVKIINFRYAPRTINSPKKRV
jgi:hypothetical protein